MSRDAKELYEHFKVEISDSIVRAFGPGTYGFDLKRIPILNNPYNYDLVKSERLDLKPEASLVSQFVHAENMMLIYDELSKFYSEKARQLHAALHR